jgi:hypothetical protein
VEDFVEVVRAGSGSSRDGARTVTLRSGWQRIPLQLFALMWPQRLSVRAIYVLSSLQIASGLVLALPRLWPAPSPWVLLA